MATLDGAPCGPGAVATVGAMVERLDHRGPDDRGIADLGAAVLGLARLSIVDLAGGHQPMSNADGTVWVAVNGEIYDHIEHRGRLRARGHRFRTTSDAEVVVHLYEERGIDCLHDLNGIFALAVHDTRTGELHLARDRVGVKPLYWSQVGRRIAWASELKALLEVPGLDVEIDREAIAEYLTLLYVPHPRTPFAGVRKLAPGTVLTVRDGAIRERTWWSWPRPTGEPAPRDIEDRVRELVVDAVRLQLRADVPVAVFASGGVDSSAILWAAGRSDQRPAAFCVAFEGDTRDAPFAERAAADAGVELRVLHLSSARAGELLPWLVQHVDEPMADPAIVPSWLVAEAAAEHVKVILSGTGGDEVFGGYGRYTLPDAAAYAAHLEVHPEADVRRALGLAPAAPVGDRLRRLLAAGAGDQLAAGMHVDGSLYLPGDLCMVLDKTSMAASLEARVPLLDHRLVELVAALPGSTRVRDGDLKHLFRSALRGHVPDAILDRPKAGFSPPVATWWSGPIGRRAERLLADPVGPARRLLGSAVDAWSAPGAVPDDLRALRMWALLVLDLWWRAYVDAEDLTDVSLTALAA